MALIVQHNMTAMNTNRQLGISTSALAKSTEKLSSGYRINRAADDAAGLAISEKMRSQIRGLEQASTNASDGISMLQTAEGALTESHSILQRMRELAVQAANGTNTDDDRANLQDEVEQLQEELDRIATDTEFNGMSLLDGSLSAASAGGSTAGPKFGTYCVNLKAFITSDVAGVKVAINNTAALGGESAIWSSDGKTLTLNLKKDNTYTQTEIDELIRTAQQEDSSATGTPANIDLNFYYGSYTVTNKLDAANAATTVAGVKGSSGDVVITQTADQKFVGANTIQIKSNKYGADTNITINIDFTSATGRETCEIEEGATYTSTGAISSTAVYSLSLQSGKEYSEADIEAILAASGLNMDVTLSGPNPDEPNTLFITDASISATVKLGGGAGLGDTDAFLGQTKYDVTTSNGSGIVLQVGANEGQIISFSIDDMSANALGVHGSKVNISTQKGATESLAFVDEALGKVSKQRSLLGAIQNRLEHTIANIDNTAENLQAAESGIRDVDMAAEMVTMSKLNILQQAGQAMLAQANQATQGVLSLLQG